MGNREIHIIPMPLLLVLFLEKYQFSFTDVTTASFIEDLIDIAKAKMHNISGVNDLEELFRTLRSTRMVIDQNTSFEIANMADIVSNDILSQMVLHNIHSKLYYVVKITHSAICLQTYDDHMHSPTHSSLINVNNQGSHQ